MKKLMENVIKYYVTEVMEEYRVEEQEAEGLLLDALQDYDIDMAIMEKIGEVTEG